MRDPNRIEQVLSLVRKQWYSNPDMRLCQLLNSAAHMAGWKDDDLFYLEDELLLIGLELMPDKETQD